MAVWFRHLQHCIPSSQVQWRCTQVRRWGVQLFGSSHASVYSKRYFVGQAHDVQDERATENLDRESQLIANAALARVTLRPPGAGAVPQQEAKFVKHMHTTLSYGETIESEARGPLAVRNMLLSLATTERVTEFQVSWVGKGGDDAGDRFLCFTAKSTMPWADYMQTRFQNTESFFVETSANVVQLARTIASRLENPHIKALRLHALVDDDSALNTLAKSLATAATVRGSLQLTSTPNIVKTREGKRRLFVYVTSSSEVQLPEATGDTFIAMPPGADPVQEHLTRFRESVHDRLRRGACIEMECRGPDAVDHSIRTLCQLQGNVAQMQVDWVQSQGLVQRARNATENGRALRLRALRGTTWEDFNETDFSTSRRLFAKASSPIKGLSLAIVSAIKEKGSAVLCVYSDNKPAMYVAVKALATLPNLWDGARVQSVPSLGRTKAQNSPLLRFYVRKQNEKNGDRLEDTSLDLSHASQP